jgi:hypothetical protein
VYAEFWWESLREINKFERPDIDGRIILKWIFRKWDVGAWNASIWFRIRSGESVMNLWIPQNGGKFLTS